MMTKPRTKLMVVAAVVAIAMAVLSAAPAAADLPVHCLHAQIVGEWVFELGPNNNDKTLHCGHHVPDTNKDHFTKHGFDLEVTKRYKLNLSDPDVATDEDGNEGMWTMVYDEGFEVQIDGKRFFAFNKYLPKTPASLEKDEVEDYISVCDETLVGWYHDDDNTHWGCYHGAKVNAVQQQHRFRQKKKHHGHHHHHHKAHKHHKELTHVVSPNTAFVETQQTQQLQLAETRQQQRQRQLAEHHEALAKHPELLLAEPHPVHLHHDNDEELFEPNMAFIEMHNSNEAATWRAAPHTPFIGRRMSDMMRLLGQRDGYKFTPSKLSFVESQAGSSRRRRRRHKKKGSHHHGHHHGHNHGGLSEKQTDAEKYANLPKHFDWRKKDGVDYDSPVKNQANCGSCYAMATVSVAEARIRIQSKNKNKMLLSTQDVVSCSIYNQGCDGGYPYLVGKYMNDFGMVPFGCHPYAGVDEECKNVKADDCPDPENPTRIYARNYSYVGGYYGACTEEAMMHEIYKKGPIMVAFDAPSSLFYYSGGIYTGAFPPHEGRNLPNLREWEKTNHAVVAVGWGEERGQKYWIIKNTWGQQWGENGYFRIKRGSDECGIESMAVSFDLILPDDN